MKKQSLFFLLVVIISFSCNPSNDFSKVFSRFILSQSKLEIANYPGVYQILEIHHYDSLTIYDKKDLLFFKMFDPRIKYRLKINENGTVQEFGNYEGYLFRIKYKYNNNEQITKISGFLPYPITLIMEYNKNSAVQSVFREGGENNYFKYSNNCQTVNCFQFELRNQAENNPIKIGGPLRKYTIIKSENEDIIINELDAKNNAELNEYIYKRLNLIKRKTSDGKTFEYEYDTYGNITKLKFQNSGKPVETYTFKYEFDKEDNWINRTIALNGIQILSTERTITYY